MSKEAVSEGNSASSDAPHKQNPFKELPKDERIRRQIEFYFSDANMRRDKFLRSKVEAEPQGFVDLSILVTFNRLKELSTDYEEICNAVKDSEVVQVSADKTKIRRKTPLPANDDPSTRTVYVKGRFPQDSELDALIAFFRQYFPVKIVHMRRTRNKEKLFKGSVFVEFENKDDAHKFVEMATSEDGLQYEGKKLERAMMQKDYLEMKKKERLEQKEKKLGFKREMIPNCILRLTEVGSGATWQTLQNTLSKVGDVKFSELDEQNHTAYLRFADANECTRVKDALDASREHPEAEDTKFSATDLGGALPKADILQGEEEKQYWEKIWDKQSARVRESSKRKKGDNPGGSSAKRGRKN
eukprot:gb/GECG01000717.1/.p1 GENE.gb/GECG01000717.1/~~gb/GECG01000717.1/.p1  ORF type:complete len:357 (+),score=59.08 gb/GECG01000717.1/:1-1071(+)